MRREMKVATLPGLMLILMGFLGTVLIQPQISRAQNSTWSDGILAEVKGAQLNQDQTNSLGLERPVEVLMEDGQVFVMGPDVKIRNKEGSTLSLNTLPVQSRVRYRAEDGVIKEIVLMEVLPR